MGVSIRAKLISSTLKVIGAKRRIAQMFKQPSRSDKANQIPASIVKSLVCESQTHNGYSLHTINNDPSVHQHIVYFHGGAYVVQSTPLVWAYLRRLAVKTQSKVTYVQYPLAPESNHRETLKHAVEVTKIIREKYSDDTLFLSGDSAGGGLSLALIKNLLEQNLQQPYNGLGLISPWVDPTRLDLVSKELDAKDLMLDIDSLKFAAEQYAGDDDISHPNVSPLKGGFKGFPPMSIWMGTRDIFYGDMPAFTEQLEKDGVDFTYHVGHEMVHDFAILPMPEGAKTIQQFAEFLKQHP